MKTSGIIEIALVAANSRRSKGSRVWLKSYFPDVRRSLSSAAQASSAIGARPVGTTPVDPSARATTAWHAAMQRGRRDSRREHSHYEDLRRQPKPRPSGGSRRVDCRGGGGAQA